MRTRHKTPTLVSMWMLDVFCCALGCVILLWILQSLATSIQADRAKDALQDLDKTRERLTDTDAKLVAANANIKQTEDRLATANADLANTRERFATATAALDVATAKLNSSTQALTAARRELSSTTKELADVQKKAEDDARTAAVAARQAEEELAKKQKAADVLKLELTTAQKEQSDLALLKRTLEDKVAAADAARRATDKQLSDLDAKYRAAAADAKDADTARADSKDMKDQLAKARTQVIDLQGEKKVVDDKFARLKADTDSRFAGIAMTGRNVCFVVDISGSMKLRDERTADPDKWPGVVDTVGRVMRSLPDLEKFQVIVFSKDAKYLFGADGEWQAFAGAKSVKKVTDTLTETVPGGDTNLYAALDLAFRLKPGGLDTVYLFSDGLPTSGQSGLTADQEKRLTDDQMTAALSKHLRGTLSQSWNPKAEGKPRVRINSLGFFYESPEVGSFLWALSRENDGSFVGMSRP